MIKAVNLTKSFPKTWIPYRPTEKLVLRGLNLEVKPGQITGLLGKNGAGKSTFFRMIAGIEPMTSGDLWIDGLNMRDDQNIKALRGKISFLPEEPGLDRLETAHFHLFLYAYMIGMSLKEAEYKIDELDEKLKLKEFWKRPFKDYSKGQKAKISFARMLLMPHASVFLFDEPTNGMDFETSEMVRELIKDLSSENKTILLASHIFSEMAILCDDIVGLENGLIVREGDLFNNFYSHMEIQKKWQFDKKRESDGCESKL